MKKISLVLSLFFLFGCGPIAENPSDVSASPTEEKKPVVFEKIIKPEYSIILTNEWEEIHPSTISDYIFQQKNIRAVFQKKVASPPLFLLVTEENIQKSTTSLEFFSGTRQNTQAAFLDFAEIEITTIDFSSSTAQILHFSARKTASSSPIFFWQMPIKNREKGIVFTAASTQESSEMTKEIKNIFSTLEF